MAVLVPHGGTAEGEEGNSVAKRNKQKLKNTPTFSSTPSEAKLRGERNAAKQSLVDAQKQIERLSKRHESTKAENASLRQAASKRARDCANLRHALERMSSEKEQLQSQLSSSREYSTKLEMKLSSALIGTQNNSNRSNAALASSHASDVKVENLQSEMEEVQSQLSTTVKERDAHAEEVAVLQRALDLRVQDIAHEHGSNDLKASLLYAVAKARRQHESVAMQLEEANDALRQNKEKSAATNSELHASRTETEQLKYQVSWLQQRAESAEAERDAYKAQAESSSAQADSFRAERDSAQSQLSGMKNKCTELQQTLESERAAHESEAARLREEVSQLQWKRDRDVQYERETWSSELQQLRDELEQEREARRQLNMQSGQQSEAAEQSRERLQELREHNRALNTQIETLNEHNAQAQREAEATKQHAEECQRVLDHERTKREQLDRLLEQLRYENADLLHKRKELQKIISQQLSDARELLGKALAEDASLEQSASQINQYLSQQHEQQGEQRASAGVTPEDLSAFRQQIDHHEALLNLYLSSGANGEQPASAEGVPNRQHEHNASALEQLARTPLDQLGTEDSLRST